MTATIHDPVPTPFGAAWASANRLTRFAWLVLAWNLVVIAGGAFVRATESGAGCGSHWPLCNGVVIPQAAETKTLIELTHRTFSGIAGILVLVLAVRTFRSTAIGHAARRPAVASLALIAFEALLGAGLVLFGWVEKDASWGRVFMLGLHLTNTFLLLAALALTASRLGGAPGARWRNQGVEGALVYSMLGLMIVVGITGAITSLGDTLFPAATLSEGVRRDFLPQSHFLERLRVVHPMLAVLTAVAIVRGSWLLSRRRPSNELSRFVRLTTMAVFVQIGLGVLNFALRAPTWMQLVHLIGADLVWISLILLSARALPIADQRSRP